MKLIIRANPIPLLLPPPPNSSQSDAAVNNTNNNNNNNNNNNEQQVAVVEEDMIKKEVPDEGGENLSLALVTKSTPSSPQPNLNINSLDLNHPKFSLPPKRKTKPSTKSMLVVSDLSRKHVRSKPKIDRATSTPQIKTPTVIRAEELQASLGSEFPSLVKLLVRSHVSSCFWMGLPMSFCKSHLPNTDTALILEDENGEQSELKYIADKTGLSAGWRKFAVGHHLLEGDVLLFHLIEPTKFKVYVVRQNDLIDMDGALSLLNLDMQAKQVSAENQSGPSTPLMIKKRKRPNLSSLGQKKKKRMSLSSRSAPQVGQLTGHSGNDSEVGSEVLEGSKFSTPLVPFKDIKSFEDFHIVVNGMCIDSELPEHIRFKYYELCCQRKGFLHNRFLPGLYTKLIAGSIGETVNIADAIKGCKLTTSWNDFAVWEKSLKSFELLGMKVGFLRNRLQSLRSLAFECQGASDFKNYLEAISNRINAEEEIRNLEAKLVELKAASEKFDADIDMLRERAEKHEFDFHEVVDASW